MNIKHTTCIIITKILFVLLASFACQHAFAREVEDGFYYGNRLINNYVLPSNYATSPQNWSVTQDKRGVIYVANYRWLLQYDGTEWTDVKGVSVPFIVATDPKDGIVYVGTSSDFGYLGADERGQVKYHSLKFLLPEGSDVYIDDQIFFRNDTVFFCGYECVVVYSKLTKQAKKWNTVLDDMRCVKFENSMYGLDVREKYLYTFAENVCQKTQFYLPESFSLLDVVRTKENEVLFSLATELQVFNEQTRTFRTVEDDVIKKYYSPSSQFDKIKKINDNQFAVSSRGNSALGAVMLMDTTYTIRERIGAETGMNESCAMNMEYSENDGLLWVSHWGLSNVNMRSPLRVVNTKESFKGHLSFIYPSKNGLYCGTTEAVYRYKKNEKDFCNFEPIHNVKDMGVIYVLEGYVNPYTGKDAIYAVTDGGIYTIEGDEAKLATKENNSDIKFNKKNGKYAFGIFRNKVTTYDINPDGTLEKKHEMDISQAELSGGFFYDGKLWVANRGADIYSIDPLEKKYVKYETEGECLITRINDDLYYIDVDNDIYVYQKDKDLFERSSLNDLLIDYDKNGVYAIERYGKGFVVLCKNEYKAGFYVPCEDGSDKYEFLPLPTYKRIAGDDAELYVSEESDSTIFIVNTNSICCYYTDGDFKKLKEDIAQNKPYDFNTLVTRVQAADSVIFYGAFVDSAGGFTVDQPKSNKIVLPYDMNSMVFNFSSTCHEREEMTEYSYMLSGRGDDWSEWSTSHKVNYTNLFEGDYVFRVKARNVYGTESRVAEYRFTVKPPVYRTMWMYMLYILLGGWVIWFLMRVYSGKLKKENERLERVVEERTEIIRSHERDILNNINYASYIQHAALTPKSKILQIFPDSFVLFRPHSIVSGDFYMVLQHESKKICVVADCTGHGVSGGFLSMLGMAYFKQVVETTQKPSEILDMVRDSIIENLHQDAEGGQNTDNLHDGMDAAVYVYDEESNTLEFAGANSRIVIVKAGEQRYLEEYRGDKMPLGVHFAHKNRKFGCHTIEVKKGDMVYSFTDGYADQFGGAYNRKFLLKNLRKLLLEVADRDVTEQIEIINNTFEAYKGMRPQTDDVLLIGVRL